MNSRRWFAFKQNKFIEQALHLTIDAIQITAVGIFHSRTNRDRCRNQWAYQWDTHDTALLAFNVIYFSFSPHIYAAFKRRNEASSCTSPKHTLISSSELFDSDSKKNSFYLLKMFWFCNKPGKWRALALYDFLLIFDSKDLIMIHIRIGEVHIRLTQCCDW